MNRPPAQHDLETLVAEVVCDESGWPDSFDEVKRHFDSLCKEEVGVFHNRLLAAIRDRAHSYAVSSSGCLWESGCGDAIDLDEHGGLRGSFFDSVKPDAACGDIKKLVSQAYLDLFVRLPEDHVVVDPIVNIQFVARCRERGASCSEFELNHMLLNLRKAGVHSGLPRIRPPGLSPDVRGEIGFASEIAARLVQFEFSVSKNVSLDRMFCNPKYRDRFDYYASCISPGYSPYLYRLAALAERKDARSRSSSVVSMRAPRFQSLPFAPGAVESIPDRPGIYAVLSNEVYLYVGRADSVRSRVARHLDSGGGGFVPDCLGLLFDKPTRLLFAADRKLESPSARIEAQVRVQRERNPVLNFQDVA